MTVNLRKLRKKLEESETVIEKIEAEIHGCRQNIHGTGKFTLKLMKLDYKKYRELKEQLNEEMNRWTLYSQEVEEFLQKTTVNGINAV